MLASKAELLRTSVDEMKKQTAQIVRSANAAVVAADAAKLSAASAEASAGCGQMQAPAATKADAVEYMQNGAFEGLVTNPNLAPVYNDLPPLAGTIGSSVEPGGISIYDAVGRRPLRDDEAAGLAGGTWTIYVWGRLRYRDVFGQIHSRRDRQAINASTKLITPCQGHDQDN